MGLATVVKVLMKIGKLRHWIQEILEKKEICKKFVVLLIYTLKIRALKASGMKNER